MCESFAMSAYDPKRTSLIAKSSSSRTGFAERSGDIIVKQHAGSIEVDTQLGEFTEIRIILPRVAVLLTERP